MWTPDNQLLIPHIEVPAGPLTHDQMMGANAEGLRDGLLS